MLGFCLVLSWCACILSDSGVLCAVVYSCYQLCQILLHCRHLLPLALVVLLPFDPRSPKNLWDKWSVMNVNHLEVATSQSLIVCSYRFLMIVENCTYLYVET